jgi:large subunit ribosomal protein L9
MDVILLERIERLGQMGDIVSVKPGYARNFLLPKNKALRANSANKARFDEQRTQLEATNIVRRGEAEQVATKLDGIKVVIVRAAGESGQLYGSVSARDIAEAVTEAGFTVGRSQVLLNRALKVLGLEEVPVSLHPEVTVTAIVNIARSQEEAEQQAILGRAVGSRDDEFDDDDEDDAPVQANSAAESADADGEATDADQEDQAEEDQVQQD